jgi:hypothetical protein
MIVDLVGWYLLIGIPFHDDGGLLTLLLFGVDGLLLVLIIGVDENCYC